ncbi:DUF6092 family protein [Spirillospora sp. NBC_00431]
MPELTTANLFGLATHMVSSAPLAFDETPVLGAFRLLDAANRLMALADADEFLAEAHADYLAHMSLAMTDQAAFRQWMSDYVARFAREALRRTMEES